MFISKFSVENWDENQNQILVKPAKNWAEIESAIKELDGQHHTLVTLETEGEAHMAIAGGSDKFLVYITFDNEHFHYLTDASNLDTEETLVVGGQEGIYPAKVCVNLNIALKATKTFSELGKMEESVNWEQDEIFQPV